MQRGYGECFRGLETACEENFSQGQSILYRSDTEGAILEQPGYGGDIYSRDMASQVEVLCSVSI
jgi:hypothetical protein